MLVKIEFRQGSFQLIDTGDEFKTVQECRSAFKELMNDEGAFFSYGHKLLINRDNVTRVLFDVPKPRYKRVKSKR